MQRRAIRRAVRLECEVVREHDFKLVATRAVDLSPEGMLVLSEATVLTGEEVIVTFRTPSKNGGAELWFDAVGTVTRVVHGRRPGDFGPCLGIHFDDAEEVSKIVLGDKLRKMPPPLPRRAVRLDYAAMIASA
jgi:hypothetical protein